MVKWVDREIKPASGGAGRNTAQAMVAQLASQPGRWAEVARYSLDRKGSAKSRGSMMVKRFAEERVEYAVEREGEEFVLYLRVRGED
jgi:hypothetical protein